MANQPDDKRNKYPEIIHFIFQYRFYAFDVLVFVNKPENENTEGKKDDKFQNFNDVVFQTELI